MPVEINRNPAMTATIPIPKSGTGWFSWADSSRASSTPTPIATTDA
jgi:hypothetical protein